MNFLCGCGELQTFASKHDEQDDAEQMSTGASHFVCYGFLAVTGVWGADLTGVCGAESMIEMFCFSILLSMICIAMASTHRSRADVDDFGADGVDGVGDADGCVDLFVGG